MRHLVPLYVPTCSGMTKLNLNLTKSVVFLGLLEIILFIFFCENCTSKWDQVVHRRCWEEEVEQKTIETVVPLQELELRPKDAKGTPPA